MAYATVEELTAHLLPDPTPANAQQLLDRASRDVDRALLCSIYDPAAQKNVDALKAATLEQVAGNLDNGSKKGAGATRRQFALGRLSVGAPAAADPNDPAGPVKVGDLWLQAWLVLQQAGLTGDPPQG